MLIDSQSYDQHSEELLQLDDARWQHYEALKRFFTDFSLPNDLGAVYANIRADQDLNPIVQLKVVDQFPDHLAKSAYLAIHKQLGESHPLLQYIESPKGL